MSDGPSILGAGFEGVTWRTAGRLSMIHRRFDR